MAGRDGHVRVLPLHVANKIAAGEVVERPASVVKELLENAIDAGAKRIAVAITQGGRKLVSVQDDGSGMTRDDAVLSLERQATSKIMDVDDIERIDTLGFRGEAIPSIASVSRFSITTRRSDSDEGTFVQVNAGTLAEVRSAGCPAGTLVEVRDLFCNVPARRKFLKAYATEEAHVKGVFTVHALAHPSVGFSLTVDGRELYRLAPTASLKDRVLELFGAEFADNLLPLPEPEDGVGVRVTGYVERPNLFTPSRRDQYVFVNGRPATAASIAYALKEAYPRRAGEARPAAIIFIELPPGQVDVNVHPTKREVRFRDGAAVKDAIIAAIGSALSLNGRSDRSGESDESDKGDESDKSDERGEWPLVAQVSQVTPVTETLPFNSEAIAPAIAPSPTQRELAIDTEPGEATRPWKWFRYLAQSAAGYLLIETDTGIVTINPQAARERIVFERLSSSAAVPSQTLLIPETVKLSPVDFARVVAALDDLRTMGFQLEEFGDGVFKIDAVPQALGSVSPAGVIATIAHDLVEGGSRAAGARWRTDVIAKSVARSFAGSSLALTEEGAVRLVEELCGCRMPYICPRGKPVMIFTSTVELNRKFAR